MIKFLDLSYQNGLVKQKINEAFSKALDQASFIGGDNVRLFEKAFSEFLGVDHCIGVANGTDGLELCLESLCLPKNSEIIVPANSFFATSEAVVRCGYKVVFCDADPKTALIDVDKLERMITPKTSAIICVHLYGNPCKMDALIEISKRWKLKLIEDCAQAHGAKFGGQLVGSFGDIAAFSFYPGKNLGGIGDGGAVVTNNEHLAARCRMLANHGRTTKYNHEIIGRNSRLDSINAAILEEKLNVLPSWLEHRNKLAERYFTKLNNKSISLIQKQLGSYHSYHLFVIRSQNRDCLIDYLKKNKIETGIHYPIALHNLEAHKPYNVKFQLQNSEELADQVVSLPMGEHLSLDDVDYVVEIVNKFHG